MIFRILDRHDAIHHDPRNPDLPWMQRAARGNSLNLRNYNTAGIFYGRGNGQHFEGQRLSFHCNIAVHVGGRAPDDCDGDREGYRPGIPGRQN